MGTIKKVLLVDDDESSNFLSKMAILDISPNIQVDEVRNGREALEYLLNVEECPEIIFLDLNMPVIDGMQFLEIYKDYVKCVDHSKVVVLTSSKRESDKDNVMKSSIVFEYILKPLAERNIQQLFTKLSGD
jgi:CheY-like chemotaxis protein